MRVWDTSHLLDEVPQYNKKNTEHTYNSEDSHANITRIRLHFKQLQTKLILGLVLGFLLPNALLSIYFHYQFAHSLKKTSMLNLTAVVESQRNTLDLYLQERVANLYNLLHSEILPHYSSPGGMDEALASLKQFNDGFVDVGFIDDKGVQTGYSGPYPHLLGKDYSQEEWYQGLLDGKKNYFISDIYLGFRGVPHFTIAIRQFFEGKPYVVRSSLDPDKLYVFLRSISHGKQVETTLINRQGIYQVVDPGHSLFPDRSDYVPPLGVPTDLAEVERNNNEILIAHSWLGEVPWALLVAQPLSVIQSDMSHTRLVLGSGLLVITLFISIVIYLAIRRLVRYARIMTEEGHHLQEMLAHASKLASIGELAEGVAHEINNPLAIIMATSGVIRDMLNPEFELDHSPEAIGKELTVIDNAATRAKGITRRLQEMGKSREPHTERCSVNLLLDEVTVRLSKVELKSKGLEIKKNYDENLPLIATDPDQLRQAFANILINAGDAITDKGTITITTALAEGMLSVSISDTGKGIPEKNLQRIFNPFFSTKGDGRRTGLGLSIAASIVKYMGGTIKVNSIVGSGSTFTILLPVGDRMGAR